MLVRLFFSMAIAMSHLVQADFGQDVKRVKKYFSQYDSAYAKFVEQHLRKDLSKCAPHPDKVSKLSLHFPQKYTREKPKIIQGSIRYIGFVPGKYYYKVFWEKSGLVVKADIKVSNLKDIKASELKKLKQKFRAAASFFNYENNLVFPVRFEFGLSAYKKNVKTKIVRRHSRGPYFLRWSLKNSVKTHAHEFAHVLGLDDEYKNRPIKPTSNNCQRKSIMCSSSQGSVLNYHYYLILRRVLC